MVVGVIAGGYGALVKSVEGAEDDVNAGAAAMDSADITPRDVVVGIAASGTTPYVGAALARAQTLGAKTALVTCSTPPKLLTETCDVVIVPKVGPEALTGSTRMKAGTATKLVLNLISTGAMIRLGKVYGNLMVDLMAMSDKLKDRGERIVMECVGVDRARARAAIDDAGGSVKVAIVMAKKGIRRDEAQRVLKEAGGFVRRAVGDPPAVKPPPLPPPCAKSPPSDCWRGRRLMACRRRWCVSRPIRPQRPSSRFGRSPTRPPSAARSLMRWLAARPRTSRSCTSPLASASRAPCCRSWQKRR